ncbi:hypothetical protein ES288_A12G226800v1 [Gossypium darwinii]|uniref:PLAT domain-containing protein n=1 Tax=Gossypium darwinii TaxID=34276 RepID=A0A5D2ECJ4_GOSDA|nr:hypothetical protein ES288_A12G226800v1 [Gossypium darwinii]
MKGCQLVSISFFVLLFSVAARPTDNDCVYTLYVKTGCMMKAGTDSRISVVLGDPFGRSVWIAELRSWGLMPYAHDYFERGNLDVFSGRGCCSNRVGSVGSCIGSPCRLNLTSDGSGWHHGWYCDYIETVFYVDQWLATDIPPFQLTAFRDGCYMQDEPRKHGRNVPLIVGNPERPA